MDLRKFITGSGKKRDLRDTSTNDNDPKEQCEGILNDC